MKNGLILTSEITLLALLGLCTTCAYGGGSATLLEVRQDEAVAGVSQHDPVSRHKHDGDSRFVPSKPMGVIHFVKPERYLASSGDTLTVNLTVMVSVPVDGVTVMAQAEKGAVVAVRQQNLDAFAALEERKVSFDVTVLTEGRHYINVFASTKTSDGVRRSSYSVPIEVGHMPQTARKRRQTVLDDQGNRLLLMPAQTTTGDEQPR